MATSLKRKASSNAEPDQHALKRSKHETPAGETYAKPTLIVITEHLAHELRITPQLNIDLKVDVRLLERKLSATQGKLAAALTRCKHLAADTTRYKRKAQHDSDQATKWCQERHEARDERARSENIWEQRLNDAKADAVAAAAAAEERIVAAEKKIAALTAENQRLVAEQAAPTTTITAAEEQIATLTAKNSRLVAENEAIRQQAYEYADEKAGQAAAAAEELAKKALAEKEAEIAALKQKISEEMVPRAEVRAFVHKQMVEAGVEKTEQGEDEELADEDDADELDDDDAAANGDGQGEEDEEVQGDATAGHPAADRDHVDDSALGSSVSSLNPPTSFFPQPEVSVPDAAITTAPAPSTTTTTIAAASNPTGNVPFVYSGPLLFGTGTIPSGGFGVDNSGASGSYGSVPQAPPPPPPAALPVPAAAPVSFPMGNAPVAQPCPILFGAAVPASGGFGADGFGASGPSGPIPQPPPPPSTFFPVPAPAPVAAAPAEMDTEVDYSSFNHSGVAGMEVDEPAASQAAPFTTTGSAVISSPFVGKYAAPGSRRAGKQRKFDDDVEMDSVPAAPLSPHAFERGLNAILAEPSKFSGRQARLSAAPAFTPPASAPTGPRSVEATRWDPTRRAWRSNEKSIEKDIPGPKAPFLGIPKSGKAPTGPRQALGPRRSRGNFNTGSRINDVLVPKPRGEREPSPSPETPIRHPRGGRGSQRKHIGAQQQQQPNRNSNPYRSTTDSYRPDPYTSARDQAASNRRDNDNKRKGKLIYDPEDTSLFIAASKAKRAAVQAANARLAEIQAVDPSNGVPGVFTVDIPIKKKDTSMDSLSNILGSTRMQRKGPFLEDSSDDDTNEQRGRAMMGGSERNEETNDEQLRHE